MREITEEMILDAIEDGWKREDAEKAERDGIKIIHDMEFNDENSAAYIDTPENRELLKDLAL